MSEELELRLIITQSNEIISVPQGEVPVILVEYPNTWAPAIVKAVNFLRSGCPKVQLVLDRNAFSDPTAKPMWFEQAWRLLRKICCYEPFYFPEDLVALQVDDTRWENVEVIEIASAEQIDE